VLSKYPQAKVLRLRLWRLGHTFFARVVVVLGAASWGSTRMMTLKSCQGDTRHMDAYIAVILASCGQCGLVGTNRVMGDGVIGCQVWGTSWGKWIINFVTVAKG